MEDLEQVITYCHEARALSLNNLASAFLARYRQSGRMEDLEMAVTYSQAFSNT
jgi:hypothetical protein